MRTLCTRNNRATWVSQLGQVPYKFFVCNPHNDTVVSRMLKEADEYKDIVYLEHIRDSYKNITLGTHEIFKYVTSQPGIKGAYFYKVCALCVLCANRVAPLFTGRRQHVHARRALSQLFDAATS